MGRQKSRPMLYRVVAGRTTVAVAVDRIEVQMREMIDEAVVVDGAVV